MNPFIKYCLVLLLITVSFAAQSAPANGVKQLYLDNLDTTLDLVRVAPVKRTRPPDITVGSSVTINQAPVFQKLFTITGGSTANVLLWVDDRGNNSANRTARVELFNGNTGTPIGLNEQTWLTAGGRQYITFPVSIAADVNFSTGDFVRVVITNISAVAGDDIRVDSVRNNQNSQIQIQSSTVINVDSIEVFAAAYPATTQYLKYVQGSTVFIRSTVSDPFGNTDISSANITITDVIPTVQVSNATMTFVATPTSSTRLYEFQYTIPALPAPSGAWNLSVTANEGFEGTVSHTAQDVLNVGNPNPVFDTSTKTVVDLNGGSAEPGDILEYTITINETGGSNTTNVQVTDFVDVNLGTINFTTLPVGSTDNTVGNNIDITGITIPATGTETIVFEATIAGGTPTATNINNMATINHAASVVSFDAIAPTVMVSAPTLTTSTNVVLDVNGGTALSGDVIRYTVTINETGGNPATNVTVTDLVDANYIGINITSIPVGAVDNTVGNTIDISNISVAANGSATIIFEASIIGTASTGTTIDNTASIVDIPTGANTSVSAATIFVGSLPTSGIKQLYLDNLDVSRDLVRVPTIINTRPNDIGVNGFVTIDQSPVFKKPFTITGGSTTNVQFWMDDKGNKPTARAARVELYKGNIFIAGNEQSWNTGARTYITFPITIPSNVNFATSDFVRIVVTNISANPGDDIRVESFRNGLNSQVRMQTSTVINVEDIEVYGAAYPATTQYLQYVQGSTVFIRATVSDPFGNADITNANITVTDTTPTVQVNNIAMTSVATPTDSTRVFEFQYTIAIAPDGFWDLSVTANEGTEGTVSHTAVGIMPVGNPSPVFDTSTKTVVDLNGGSAEPGDILEYTVTINDTGGSNTAGTIQLTDVVEATLNNVNITTLPVGATDNTAGNNVDVTSITVPVGGTATLVFEATIVLGTLPDTKINNTATINHAATVVSFDVAAPTVIVSAPNLSTSTKIELDVNGLPALVGDLIRYTITINETGGHPATNISVTDVVDANLVNLTVTSIPSGAVNNTAGNNIDISNISIIANGIATIIYEANIVGTANTGTIIDNTAVITDIPTGSSTSPAARTIFVTTSPASGIKQLYFDHLDTTLDLVRTIPVVNTRPPGNLTVGNFITVDQTPVFQTPFTITGGSTANVQLWLRDRGGGSGSRSVQVDLFNGNTGILIGSNTQTWNNGRVYLIFPIAIATDENFATGDFVRIVVTNVSAAPGDDIRVETLRNGLNSQIQMQSVTVVNVDAVDIYTATYPATSKLSSYLPNSTVFIRATVSDPFGSADITSANLTVTDPTPTVQLNTAAMTSVATPTGATRIFEYQYTIPTSPEGLWTLDVTANEGSEGTVSHTAQSTMIVGTASITNMKLSAVISDPVNVSNPKAITNAIIEYTVSLTNSGFGYVDNDTVVLTDTIPAKTTLFLGSPANPVKFIDGIVASGLSYSFSGLASMTDDIDFSNDGGSTFISPSVDVDGFDSTIPQINFIRISPKGDYRGSDGLNNPAFSVKFRVRIN